MEQKQQFVSLLSSDQFTMSELCKTFGISRKTGHKWRDRYAVHGMAGLVPQSRAPKSVTCRTDEAVERLIVAERHLHPTWGAKFLGSVVFGVRCCIATFSLDSPVGVPWGQELHRNKNLENV